MRVPINCTQRFYVVYSLIVWPTYGTCIVTEEHASRICVIPQKEWSQLGFSVLDWPNAHLIWDSLEAHPMPSQSKSSVSIALLGYHIYSGEE